MKLHSTSVIRPHTNARTQLGGRQLQPDLLCTEQRRDFRLGGMAPQSKLNVNPTHPPRPRIFHFLRLMVDACGSDELYPRRREGSHCIQLTRSVSDRHLIPGPPSPTCWGSAFQRTSRRICPQDLVAVATAALSAVPLRIGRTVFIELLRPACPSRPVLWLRLDCSRNKRSRRFRSVHQRRKMRSRRP